MYYMSVQTSPTKKLKQNISTLALAVEIWLTLISFACFELDLYSFTQNRFHGLWSSQRQPASLRLNLENFDFLP